jgi:tRNA C32,U32 (ribose-2'-O)-methylase TrmJ
MSTVATRAALVVPAARGASGGRARSSGVSRPRRRTAARRRPECASSAMRPSAASASLDDGEDEDEGNPTTDVTSFSRPADGKQPVPSPTSRLSNVCFVLCRPQGPANVGGIARVMNNFGITDLRVVAPEPGALAPPFDALMDDGSDRAIHSAKDRSTAPFADEARIMAVHAAHLLRDAGRFETAADAVADCVFVAATTARPRENLPIVSVRDACASASRASVSQNASKNANSSLSLTDATNDGKVAILFGNEATGLTNEELSLANVGVMIPTASFGVPDQSEGKKNEGKKKKTKRYTGGVGPTSLNLSHAVGVCAYEVHQAMGDTLVSGFNSRLITAEERVRLADELHKARRALDVLRTPETRDATNDDGTSSDPRTTDASGTSGTTTDVERLEHARERRAIANVLNAGPIASRDAAALFALARRVAVASSFSGTDAAVLAAARAFFLTEKTEKTDGGRAAVVKALIKAVREACGVSMTAREAERVIEALGKPEEGPGETSAKREGSTSSTDSTDR